MNHWQKTESNGELVYRYLGGRFAVHWNLITGREGSTVDNQRGPSDPVISQEAWAELMEDLKQHDLT